MRLTRDLAKAIKREVHKHYRGRNRLEIVERYTADGGVSNNALDWPEDTDLFEWWPMDEVRELHDSKKYPGWYALDLHIVGSYEGETDSSLGYVTVLMAHQTVVGSTGLDPHRLLAAHGLTE